MDIQNKKDIIKLIENDVWMMEILKAAKTLNLPDWWVCAGFVRSKIWDTLHGFKERTPLGDIDVVYYDLANLNEDIEKQFEQLLHEQIPGLPWSVKNEARMHLVSDFEPYTSAVDAISKFPETVTALGVKLDEKDELVLTAPCGIEDVLNMEVKPTKEFTLTKVRKAKYMERIEKKNWPSIWKKVKIIG